MFGVIMPLCNGMFLGDISALKSGWNMKKLFFCPALELFHCLPLWKTMLFVSSRVFSLSKLTFLLSTPVENSEATWKKATKCNKCTYTFPNEFPDEIFSFDPLWYPPVFGFSFLAKLAQFIITPSGTFELSVILCMLSE